MKRRDILKSAGLLGGAGIFGLGFYVLTDDPADGADPSPPTETTSKTETEKPPTDTETTEPPTERTPKASDIPHSESFETVVDAVDVGADPTGKTTVNSLFEDHGSDGTLLAFEPGTYKIDYFNLWNIDHFGIVGYGDGQVKFVPAGGDCRGGHHWVSFDNVGNLLLENVVFDFRGSSSGGPLHLYLHGDSIIRDVSYLGSCSNQIATIGVAVQDRRGTARLKNVVAKNTDRNNTLTGIYVGSSHAGEITFEDCTLENFSDNGLYASSPGGPGGKNGVVNVLRGNYHNNNISNVRLGSSNARAKGVRITVDEEMPGWGQLNARGFRLRNASGQVIEDCEVIFKEGAADSFGAVVFHQQNGTGLIQNTKIRIDRGGIPAIRIFPYEGAEDGAPKFRDLDITGRADTGVTARVEGRNGTTFENCTIEQTTGNRRGLQFVDSADCRIVDSRIEVAEAPLAVENSTVEIENCTVRTAAGEERIEHRMLENETLTI